MQTNFSGKILLFLAILISASLGFNLLAHSQKGANYSKQGTLQRKIPEEALAACREKVMHDDCTVKTPHGEISGQCLSIEERLACVPDEMRRGRSKDDCSCL